MNVFFQVVNTGHSQTLTVPEVIRAIEKASKNKKLGAQTERQDGCQYRWDDGCGCAIGVALNKDTINSICTMGGNLNDWGIEYLTEVEDYKAHYAVQQDNPSLLKVKNQTTLSELQTLQRKHDAWANTPLNSDIRTEQRKAFWDHVKVLRKRYSMWRSDSS